MKYKSRIDSKGRLAIPFNIRKNMEMKAGDEFIISSIKGKGISLAPHNEGVRVQMLFGDILTLKSVVDTLSHHNIDIIRSELSTSGDYKHFVARLELKGFDSNKLERKLLAIKNMKDVRIFL